MPYRRSGSHLRCCFIQDWRFFKVFCVVLQELLLKVFSSFYLRSCGTYSLLHITPICSIFTSLSNPTKIQKPLAPLSAKRCSNRVTQIVQRDPAHPPARGKSLTWSRGTPPGQQQRQFSHATLPARSAPVWRDYLVIWGDNSFFTPFSTLR